jgi:biopolymer transport protein ExbD
MLKRKRHESDELELTTLLNILVVLVSFLLLSAVFSKITIQELNMPPRQRPAEVGKDALPVVIA